MVIDSIGERFSSKYVSGEIISSEGPGKGFASYPWVLDKYERALGLKPAEAWLLHRMIKHCWKGGGQVFISMSKVCREATISRPTLMGLVKSLQHKGYIDEIGRKPYGDNRAIYDISGIFFALTSAITCDPKSKWSQKHGNLCIANFDRNPKEELYSFSEPRELNDYYNQRGMRFNWCQGYSEQWQVKKKKPGYQLECSECECDFPAGSATAKYCPNCKEKRRQEQWLSFQRAYQNCDDVIDND
jgi:hypothetical protein